MFTGPYGALEGNKQRILPTQAQLFAEARGNRLFADIRVDSRMCIGRKCNLFSTIDVLKLHGLIITAKFLFDLVNFLVN